MTKKRVLVTPFFLILFSALLAPFAVLAGEATSLESLAHTLASFSDGRIQVDSEIASRCGPSGDGTCAKWITKEGGGPDYLDTENPGMSEDTIQRLFTFDWDPTREGGMSFLDFEEARYRSYSYRVTDRRYVFPIERMYGWTGLDHPPIREIHQPLSDFHPLLGRPLPLLDDHPFYTEAFQEKLDQMSDTELTSGNRVDLLKNHDSYLEKLDLIRRSKHRLWVTSMLFYCDQSSTSLLDAMEERVRAGVDVRLIIEGLYADTAFRSCVKKIRGRGINVLPLTESITARDLTHITHSKFWIRDGEEAIIGGQNILDDENLSNGLDGGYRDTDAWIHEGPAVSDLEKRYLEIWTKNRKEGDSVLAKVREENQIKIKAQRASGLRGKAVFARLKNPETRSTGICRVVSQEPSGGPHSIAPVLAALAGETRELAIITTPRMKYDPEKGPASTPAGMIYQALVDAAKRGARIDLITDGSEGMGGSTTTKYRALAGAARAKGDNAREKYWLDFADDLGRLTSKGSFEATDAFNLQSSNIHTWNYFRFAHQKIHFFDRRLVGIGSFNLDGHSAHGNRETELFCMDDSLIHQVEEMLTLDLANSIPVRK